MSHSQGSSSPLQLRFGIELEIYITSKKFEHETWTDAAKELSKYLDITHEIWPIFRKGWPNHHKWTIASDSTLYTIQEENQWGMELISPISILENPQSWKPDLLKLWSALENNFTVEINRRCSTHVHVSPVRTSWSVDHVRRIGKAIMFFERSVDSIMPPERQKSTWARSNRFRQHTKDKSLEVIFDMLDAAKSIKDVAMVMSSRDEGTGPARNSRWNFVNALPTGRGTLEFRQPPGSKNASKAERWILFVTSFVQAALQDGNSVNAVHEPEDLGPLKNFLQIGAMANGLDDASRELLDSVFKDKVFGVFTNSPSIPDDVDVEEIERRSREPSPAELKFQQ